MIGLDGEYAAITLDRIGVLIAAGQRVAKIVQCAGVLVLQRECASQGGFGLIIQFQAQQCGTKMVMHLWLVRAFVCRSREIANSIRQLRAVQADHAHQMQAVEMPRVLQDQFKAAALRLLEIARAVVARGGLHAVGWRWRDHLAGCVNLEAVIEGVAHSLVGGRVRYARFLPDGAPRDGFGRVGAMARFGFAAGFTGLPPRSSAIVARVVICSGFMRSSITAGRPLAAARRNAGENSAVSLTTSPWPPNASMNLPKSGLVRPVPDTRPGYVR